MKNIYSQSRTVYNNRVIGSGERKMMSLDPLDNEWDYRDCRLENNGIIPKTCGYNKTFILESDTFSATSTTMSFYYHMHGATIGTLYVDESTDGGTSWSNLFSKSGEQQSDETEPWVQITSGSSAGFSAISSSANKLRIRYYSGSSYTGDAAIDQIVVTYSTGPSISVGSSISNLNYTYGYGPSVSQSTTVSGSNLEADITLTAPTNFEISTDNSSFADSATLSHSGGTVNSTTIYARLKSGLNIK